MQVKIIECQTPGKLEQEVNVWLQSNGGKEFVDIKYCGCTNHAVHSSDYYSAMIIYK